MIEIVAIAPGGSGSARGLHVGDCIVAVNGQEVRDVIDFSFLAAEEHIAVTVRSPGGRTRIVSFAKEPDDALGLEFAPFRITRCRNRCVFCFVDQMPAGCRKSLYVKDDDYRASFLYGNYITLGALGETDWQRIFSQRLSPLYISVHATDPALRAFLIGNRRAPDIRDQLARLAAGGIRMHTQIVLCPGLNDGRHLEQTLEDLAALFPAVLSIAVVPVGLTAHRRNCYPLRPFTRREARQVIDAVVRFGTPWKRRTGTRLAFPSDEFYIQAGRPLPPAAFYEDFPQQENGIGMTAAFLRGMARTRLPHRITPLRVALVTGVSFSAHLKAAAARLNAVAGASVRVVTVPNRFFGPSVTVAGLLTGGDILAALRTRRRDDLVIVPATALKEDDTVFLDDLTIGALEQKLGVAVRPAEDFHGVLARMREAGRRQE